VDKYRIAFASFARVKLPGLKANNLAILNARMARNNIELAGIPEVWLRFKWFFAASF
jgi:hypothetical protein